jgi:SAM-dependent methyltransferase
MSVQQIFPRVLLALVLSLAVTAVTPAAQSTKQEYEPKVGQEGKDVEWVPTPQALVDKMLDMAKATPKDYVIDLGSGDGRTVITAAKRGIRAHGIEYNPNMVQLAKRNAAKEGVSDKATFAKADLFVSDFSKATVLTLFLLPEINLKLRSKILNLKPGTRIVSNTFGMEEWEPDESATVGEGCGSWCTAHLWVVPAKAHGTWRLAHGELSLKQTFQKITGTLSAGAKTMQISDGKLNGDRITLSAAGAQYSGRVNGNVMEGSLSSGETWKAIRTAR